VKGTSGAAILRGKRTDGNAFTYAIRIVCVSNQYQFASCGVMTGSAHGEQITLIDQDNDGNFAEVGVDAIVIGKGDAASFLSNVVSLGGKLYNLKVVDAGEAIELTPWQGDTGRLNLRKGFKGGKLTAAVVKLQGADVWFEVGNENEGLEVPVGTYEIVAGLAQQGQDRAKLRQGKMPPLVVTTGESTKAELGSPVMAELSFTRNGPDVTVQPSVQFFGRNGEEWHTMLPELKSPKLTFHDKETGKLLASARFEQC
jgi:hypothetical protein